MSKNCVIRTTIDEDVKLQATSFLATMGLTMPDAVRIFFTCIATEKQWPLSPLEPNLETIEAMQELDNYDLESFETIEELFEELNA